MNRTGLTLTLILLLCCFSGLPARPAESETDLSGFVPLFDGKSLEGWHPFGDEPEGRWTVEEGAIIGVQYPEGKGGLLVTDKQFSNYELYAEVYTTYPLDTGLFLRILPGNQHFQITIDYRPTGEIGAVYGPFPGGGGGFFQHCFLGFTYWNPNEFNPIRVRIEGNPPRIQVWVRETKVTDYQDTYVEGQPRFTDTGSIGIQVHPGESWGKGSKVSFCKIMVKELK